MVHGRCLGDCPPDYSPAPGQVPGAEDYEGHEGIEQGPAMMSEWPDEAPDANPRSEVPFGDLYAPLTLEQAEFERQRQRGHVQNGSMVPFGEMRGRPDASEGARVPLDEALPAYREGFESAIRSGAVPPEYRDSVRRYFDGLREP